MIREPTTGHFYPRSPCGERLTMTIITCTVSKFLSTLSLRRATRSNQSIISQANDFYPRSPCGERLRLVTEVKSICHNFYPRSPCGERPGRCRCWVLSDIISIHALLAESDIRNAEAVSKYMTFLSTLSLRRATTWARGSRVTYVISIHALLAESDNSGTQADPEKSISIHALLAESDKKNKKPLTIRLYFYPRSPCGERQPAERHANNQQEFLSTLSLRRATV